MEQFQSISPSSMARVEVQRHFCDNCANAIRHELEHLEGIKNIRLYPRDLLITFNFLKAEHLSSLLNMLSVIGYPERGEHACDMMKQTKTMCSC